MARKRKMAIAVLLALTMGASGCAQKEIQPKKEPIIGEEREEVLKEDSKEPDDLFSSSVGQTEEGSSSEEAIFYIQGQPASLPKDLVAKAEEAVLDEDRKVDLPFLLSDIKEASVSGEVLFLDYTRGGSLSEEIKKKGVLRITYIKESEDPQMKGLSFAEMENGKTLIFK